jgi:hypothetical protein
MSFEIGRFDNISLEDYHRKYDGWSKSALDKVTKSIAHYQASVESFDADESAAKALGSAFHCAILTPELYKSEYVVAPICDKRTKAGKEEYEAFLKECPGKNIVTAESAGVIELMIKSVREHPIASALFSAGDAEHSFFWIDKRTGLKCKCRPDYLRRDKLVIDLKTTRDAGYFPFQRDIVNYRYHVQGAYFCDGITAVTGEKHGQFLIVAVETSAPYAISIYNLDSDGIAVGRRAYQLDLDKIVAYDKQPEAEKWAGYTPVVQDMFLPAWAS